jgi:hypothetical protein
VADVQQLGQVRQFHPRPSMRLTARSFMLVDQLPVRIGDNLGLSGVQPIGELVGAVGAKVGQF